MQAQAGGTKRARTNEMKSPLGVCFEVTATELTYSADFRKALTNFIHRNC